MSNQVKNDYSSSSIQNVMSDIHFGPAGGIQMLFAALQLAQSEICKDQAEGYMDKIKDSQAKQQECAEMIELARAQQNAAEAGDCCTKLDGELEQYYKDNGLSWDTAGNDNLHTAEEWEYNIKSLTNYQEQLGTETQTDMVYLQDLMGQYNSFLQGANKATTDSAQTLNSILSR